MSEDGEGLAASGEPGGRKAATTEASVSGCKSVGRYGGCFSRSAAWAKKVRAKESVGERMAVPVKTCIAQHVHDKRQTAGEEVKGPKFCNSRSNKDQQKRKVKEREKKFVMRIIFSPATNPTATNKKKKNIWAQRPGARKKSELGFYGRVTVQTAEQKEMQ